MLTGKLWVVTNAGWSIYVLIHLIYIYLYLSLEMQLYS